MALNKTLLLFFVLFSCSCIPVQGPRNSARSQEASEATPSKSASVPLAPIAPTASMPGPIVAAPAITPTPATLSSPITKTYTKSYLPSKTSITNPERGLYSQTTLSDTTPGKIKTLAGTGLTLMRLLVNLPRVTTLPSSLFNSLENAFLASRQYGIKSILRFRYSVSSSDGDAPLWMIEGHIEDLAPLMQKYADVISTFEAGFIGAWGEWHSSTNDLSNTQDRAAVLHSMLTNFPQDSFIQIRTPMYKKDVLNYLANFPDSETFPRRIGHYNDCFLASDSDYGTYASPVSSWKDFIAKEGATLPVGGETCRVYAPRTNCQTALFEMAMLGWDQLHQDYNLDVINIFKAQGCWNEIKDRLGYQFQLGSMKLVTTALAGDKMELSLSVNSRGFATTFKKRPLLVVLYNETRSYKFSTSIDTRTWFPGKLTSQSTTITIPKEVIPGIYRLGIMLPDPSEELASNSRFSIRFSNEGTWDGNSGINILFDGIEIFEK